MWNFSIPDTFRGWSGFFKKTRQSVLYNNFLKSPIYFAAGEDFIGINTTINFRRDSESCLPIIIQSDQFVENIETFQVSITSEDEAVAIILGEETINIIDVTSKLFPYTSFMKHKYILM